MFYATVFVQIKDYSVGREAYVQAQIDRGEKKIYLPMYPAYTGDYIRGSTPKDGSVWEERYKMFYHIDPNIDLVTARSQHAPSQSSPGTRVMDLPVRRHPRLPSHDYTDGWYFITICTDGRKNLLSTIVGRGLAPAETILTRYGKNRRRRINSFT